jgi:hypothetical protein
MLALVFVCGCELPEARFRAEGDGPVPFGGGTGSNANGVLSLEHILTYEGALYAENVVATHENGSKSTVDMMLQLFSDGTYKLDIDGQVISGNYQKQGAEIALDTLGNGQIVQIQKPKTAGFRVRFPGSLGLGSAQYRFKDQVVFAWMLRAVSP